jgi:hypothetical protein
VSLCVIVTPSPWKGKFCSDWQCRDARSEDSDRATLKDLLSKSRQPRYTAGITGAQWDGRYADGGAT